MIGAGGDDRLIALLQSLGSGVTYLSGKGDANYQDPAKFAANGISLEYSSFTVMPYPQGHDFIPGLSIVDALFRIGLEKTVSLVRV